MSHTKKGGERIADYGDIAHLSAELSVNIGLIQASMHLDDSWTEEVKDNFQEKVDNLHEYLSREMMEFIQFGEAYDKDD